MNDKKILAAYKFAALKEIELNKAEEELRAAQAKRQRCYEEAKEAKNKLQLQGWKAENIFIEETVTPLKV